MGSGTRLYPVQVLKVFFVLVLATSAMASFAESPREAPPEEESTWDHCMERWDSCDAACRWWQLDCSLDCDMYWIECLYDGYRGRTRPSFGQTRIGYDPRTTAVLAVELVDEFGQTTPALPGQPATFSIIASAVWRDSTQAGVPVSALPWQSLGSVAADAFGDFPDFHWVTAGFEDPTGYVLRVASDDIEPPNEVAYGIALARSVAYPWIRNVACDNYAPTALDPVTVTAELTDDVGISSAILYYRDSDGVVPGAWSSLSMDPIASDQYGATVPGGHGQSQLDLYLEVTDTDGHTVTVPTDAPADCLALAIGATAIYDVQYAHPDSASQSSSFEDAPVNIQGVVTAVLDQVGAPSRLVVQEPVENVATGTYAFGGVFVRTSPGSAEFFRGDLVSVCGHCREDDGTTEIVVHNNDAIALMSFSNELPPAARVKTRVLADDTDGDGTGFLGEAWEGVWARTFPSVVLDTLSNGEFVVADNESGADSLVVAPHEPLVYAPAIGDVVTVEGFTMHGLGRFAIVPLGDEFVVQTGLSAAGGAPHDAGRLLQAVYPNPFNPATRIEFIVDREDLVDLQIYDVRGRRVRNLVRERLPARRYALHWDGKDDGGGEVASGVYFARLQVGTDAAEALKMVLVR